MNSGMTAPCCRGGGRQGRSKQKPKKNGKGEWEGRKAGKMEGGGGGRGGWEMNAKSGWFQTFRLNLN